MRSVVSLPLLRALRPPSFDETLRARGLGPLTRARVGTLQVNVGKHCNMACQHCHVDAGPKRTERMSRKVAERVVVLLEKNPTIERVDITGGAPELNENFRYLVSAARRLGRSVIDRCNLTVLFEPGMQDLDEFLAHHEVGIVASLPCYQADNVTRQRGAGAFDKSVRALRRLNALGYGMPGSRRLLDLVYNPLGAFLPPPQEGLEATYKRELLERFGIRFHRLLTITNMPISRFLHALERAGHYDAYLSLLTEHFNEQTVPELMCRSLVSVAWDGRLYDCDFNQMAELSPPEPRTVWDIESFEALAGARVATADHCFGCTAGAGSSCGGALQ